MFESKSTHALLRAVGVVVAALFVVLGLWTLGSETLVSSRRTPAVAALAVALGALVVTVGFSVTTTE